MEKILSKRESNKAEKRTLLINAAERLFIDNGFENTSIDEVAKQAGLTKRTLYQYFLSKEDLFYAVVLKGARQLLNLYEEEMSKGSSALEKIALANQAYLKFYTDYAGMFRLMNYRPANEQNVLASPNYHGMETIDSIRMKYNADMIDSGMHDGSMNADLDVKKAVFFAFFSAFSLLYTVSTMDTSSWDALGLDENDFIRYCFDLIVKALK